MDPAGEIILSTAPKWHHPSPDHLPWRDHWIQSVYSLPQDIYVNIGSVLNVKACHDDYSLWFSSSAQLSDLQTVTERPWCHYPAKLLWSRPRMAMLNDSYLHKIFVNIMNKISDSATVLCVGDMTLLPGFVSSCALSTVDVYTCEPNSIGCKALQDLFLHNKLKNISVLNCEPEDFKEANNIKYLISEPFFTQSLLPWHDLRFWQIRTKLKSFLDISVTVMPFGGKLKMIAVEFQDLWKIRAPVKCVEGFDVSIMDDMINSAMQLKENHICEPHALWEYPSKLLSEPVTVLEFDFGQNMLSSNIKGTGVIEINSNLEYDSRKVAMVLWMEFDFGSGLAYSTGLVDNIKWNSHHKQAVFFMSNNNQCRKDNIVYEVIFNTNTLELETIFK